MKFLVYSATTAATIESSLGSVDYSYYFVLQSFLPLLRRFGEVEVLSAPLDEASLENLDLTPPCYYLSFTPPGKLVFGRGVSVIPVFAWEFGSLPDEPVIDERDNWRYMIERAGQAITHSSFAANVVKGSLGADFPVVSIPAPVWDDYQTIQSERDGQFAVQGEWDLPCTVIDSAAFRVAGADEQSPDLAIADIIPVLASDASNRLINGRIWDGRALEWRAAEAGSDLYLWGFGLGPTGQVSSRARSPWLLLSAYVSGSLVIEVDAALPAGDRTDPNQGFLELVAGGQSTVIKLTPGPQRHRFAVTLETSTNTLLFSTRFGGEAFELHRVCVAPAQPLAKCSSPQTDLLLDASLSWSGMHDIEPWGRWTEAEDCSLVLPLAVSGAVAVRFSVMNTLAEGPASFDVHLGQQKKTVETDRSPQAVELLFTGVGSSDHLGFAGICTAVSADDQRRLGLALASLEVEPLAPTEMLVEPLTPRDLLNDDGVRSVGLHAREPWGRWAAESELTFVLPYWVNGHVVVRIQVVEHPQQRRGALTLNLGGQIRSVVLTGEAQTFSVEFQGLDATQTLQCSGPEPVALEGGEDLRRLGIGLAALEIVLQAESDVSADTRVDFDSGSGSPALDAPVIYTALFNPVDERKNWPDLINAFVFALRDQPRAVLVIKAAHRELQPFLEDFCGYFASLAPFQCRLIFIHGYLDPASYRQLIRRSAFIVSASRGEGQCLPLMEFMSGGVPAIAPNNTAMADYVSAQNSFLVASTVEPAVWPQDPRLLLRTTRYRINWESLYDAFATSFQVAVTEPARYAAMSVAASESLRNYCSMETAQARLQALLEELSGATVGDDVDTR